MNKKEKDNSQIPEETLKKIKSQEEFKDFFSDLYKNAVEGMLKAEMDEHLGYEQHKSKDKETGNSRNGYSNKVPEYHHFGLKRSSFRSLIKT